jgi:hypothetical protein
MKEIILTGCAAVLFSIGAMAQAQDTTSINNNLRQGAQEVEESTEEAGNEIQQRSEQTGNEIKEESQEAGNELRQGAERTGNEIEQGEENAGDKVEQGAEEVEEGAEKAGDEIEQGAERTGEQMEQGAERAKDKMDDDGTPSSNSTVEPSSDATDNSPSMGANTSSTPAEIEVMEDKEGPNNQVVYKYQGGLYYVDRDQKQLVKIEESQLKDAEHKAIVSNDDESKKDNK